MSTLKQTQDGDLELPMTIVQDFGTNVAHLLTGRFRLFYRSWFADQSLGVPYLETILVKNPNEQAVKALFRQVILDTPGVKEILTYTFALDAQTRTATWNSRILLADGTVLVGGTGEPFRVVSQ